MNSIMMDGRLYCTVLYNYPKRQLALEKWIVEVLPKRREVKELCQIRWVERHDAYDVFVDLFLAVVSCLEEIAHALPADCNRVDGHI